MISGKAIVAGVLGWPVSHSLSPRLHGYWLDHHRIDGAYVPLAISPENFEAAFKSLAKLGFAGVNLTVPHKEKALELVDDLDPVAAEIGAVNTVVARSDGTLSGYNTDAFGFIENLRQGCAAHDFANRPAAVLGAGGAARAVVSALHDAGVAEIRIMNRTRERAEALATSMSANVRVVDFDDPAAGFQDAGLLVNTTSLGMTGSPPLEISLTALPTDALVNDIVYAPLRTNLLRQAVARGNPVVDGLGMLLHQARAGFEMWFGILPDVTEELRGHVLAHQGA